jgi:hypothetical protein
LAVPPLVAVPALGAVPACDDDEPPVWLPAAEPPFDVPALPPSSGEASLLQAMSKEPEKPTSRNERAKAWSMGDILFISVAGVALSLRTSECSRAHV